MNKKIVITGATGLIGNELVLELSRLGDEITILSTHPEKARRKYEKLNGIHVEKWSPVDKDPSRLAEILEGKDAVINLAGVNLAGKRWNEEFKKVIYDSRIDSTKALVEAMKLCDKKPDALINASAVGYYGFRKDEILSEDSQHGSDFLAKLVYDWEKEAFKAEDAGIRFVTVRTGIVLDKYEGALPKLSQPIRYFIGGYIGSGNQWMSWIHISDIRDIFIFCVYNNIAGAVNGTAPDPVTNKDFTYAVCKKLNRPCIFPVFEFALKLAVGEFAENLLNGQRVLPGKATSHGFQFKFPQLDAALDNLLK